VVLLVMVLCGWWVGGGCVGVFFFFLWCVFGCLGGAFFLWMAFLSWTRLALPSMKGRMPFSAGFPQPVPRFLLL